MERQLWVKASRRTSYWQNHLRCLPLALSYWYSGILCWAPSSRLPTYYFFFFLPSFCPRLHIDRVFMGLVINVTSSFSPFLSFIWCYAVISSSFCLILPCVPLLTTESFNCPHPTPFLHLFIFLTLVPLFLFFLHGLLVLPRFHPSTLDIHLPFFLLAFLLPTPPKHLFSSLTNSSLFSASNPLWYIFLSSFSASKTDSHLSFFYFSFFTAQRGEAGRLNDQSKVTAGSTHFYEIRGGKTKEKRKGGLNLWLLPRCPSAASRVSDYR